VEQGKKAMAGSTVSDSSTIRGLRGRFSLIGSACESRLLNPGIHSSASGRCLGIARWAGSARCHREVAER